MCYRIHVANYNFLGLGLERAGDSMQDINGMQVHKRQLQLNTFHYNCPIFIFQDE